MKIFLNSNIFFHSKNCRGPSQNSSLKSINNIKRTIHYVIFLIYPEKKKKELVVFSSQTNKNNIRLKVYAKKIHANLNYCLLPANG
jgi:hypothetical protein